ncbi:hypothetical protein KKA14_09930 [bacterium]|nr:hypothetical protein [bacterium]
MEKNKESNSVSQLQIEEFKGVCRGISSNGSICKEEATLLCDWLSENRSLASKWPYSELHERLKIMIQTDELSKSNEKELYGILRDLISVHLN